MTEQEKQELAKTIGSQATENVKSILAEYETRAKNFATEAAKGRLTEEQFNEYKTAADKAVNEVKDIAVKQGSTLQEISEKLNSGEVGTKSIETVLEESKPDLKSIFQNRQGTKTFMINVNSKGQFVMMPYDTIEGKAVGPVATIAGAGGVGTVASIAQAIDAATLLRIGADAAITSQYRNNPWVFGLVNMINASFATPFATWYDEIAKDGTSATVAEGATKPQVQYKYELKTATYKKEACLIGFTEEFNLDFPRLVSDILGKARVDLINRINTAILPNITSAATAYNTATEFKDGVVVPAPNDFDAIAAMNAQVENSTFGAGANVALMSTFKKNRMGISKDDNNGYLNAPDVLNGVSFVGNPGMASGAVIVGDLKQYNVILRGGLIVRFGYNGTDFAENKFSYVLEQFYMDYISNLRKPAIVKGPLFSDVKTAIGA
jgi:hypothetical protein